MKSLKLALTLAATLAQTVPASAAVTFDRGSVRAHTALTMGEFGPGDTRTDRLSSVPGNLTASTSLVVNRPEFGIGAMSFVNAVWQSSTQGRVVLDWAWGATKTLPNDAVIGLNGGGRSFWTYSFTTDDSAADFTATWTQEVGNSLGSTFGLGNIRSLDGLPRNVTPDTATPTNGSGTFKVALAPNTSYTFSLFHSATLFRESESATDLNARMFFDMSWFIAPAPIPEPGTWALFIAGLVAIGSVAWRRQSWHAGGPT
jgi:hypothetical protein